MAEKTFTLYFKGYWRDSRKDGIPAESGLYCVYTCTCDKQRDTVSLGALIYIGAAGDVRDRLANHEQLPYWQARLERGQQLSYSFAPCPEANRERCGAALIFEHKPAENDEYKHDFPFDRSTLHVTGKFLKPKFAVDRH